MTVTSETMRQFMDCHDECRERGEHTLTPGCILAPDLESRCINMGGITIKDQRMRDQIRLWATTIETVEDLAENEPIKDIPSIAAKLRDAAEGLRDRFGEYLVSEAMAGRMT